MDRDYGYYFMERNEERLFAGEPADGYSGTKGNNPVFGIKGMMRGIRDGDMRICR